MLEQMLKFFVSGFVYPHITVTGLALGIGLSIAFGAVWLIGYWPPLFKRPWLWVVAASSAILSWIAVSFLQIPLQAWAGQALVHFWSQQTLMRWLLLAGIPQILLSGLVQEGSKLVPVVIWWHGKNKTVTARSGVTTGAVAGAGFGVFEAVWVLNMLFASGWSWNLVERQGLLALLPFWERFFTVAFHTGSCALAGYGLAKGWGWQFYLIAAFLHGIVNYSVVLVQTRVLTQVQMEIYIAAVAAVLTAVLLRIRWKSPAHTVDEVSLE